MNWYSGNISQAVQLSKEKNAIFVVYIDGTDAMSTKMRKFINSDPVKSILERDSFVAIRIESGSESYVQFAQIYKLVPMPSLFFIGKNGTPVEIITGIIESSSALAKKIENVLLLNGPTISSTSVPAAQSESTNFQAESSEPPSGAVATEIICDRGVCRFVPTEPVRNLAFNTNVPSLSSSVPSFRSNVTGLTTDDDGKSSSSGAKGKKGALNAENKNVQDNAEDSAVLNENMAVAATAAAQALAEAAKNQASTSKNAGKGKHDATKTDTTNHETDANANEAASNALVNNANVHSHAKGNANAKANKTGKTENHDTDPISKEEGNAELLEQARLILAGRRKAQEEATAREERAKEVERRTAGKKNQGYNEQNKEAELQKLKEERIRDRLAEQEARSRILEKIASDRAERAHKFTPTGGVGGLNKSEYMDSANTSTNATPSNTPTPFDPNSSRIQFRTQDGEKHNHTFQSSDVFAAVRNYVAMSILHQTANEFRLATTFPKREFCTNDDILTLMDLELVPTAVILVFNKGIARPDAGQSSGQLLTTLQNGATIVMSPIYYVFDYIRGLFTRSSNNQGGPHPQNQQSDFILYRAYNAVTSTIGGVFRRNPEGAGHNVGAQKRCNEDRACPNDEAKKRNINRLMCGGTVNDGASTSTAGSNDDDKPESTYRRTNIHRLKDFRDSDDENATWNGNSTQQQ